MCLTLEVKAGEFITPDRETESNGVNLSCWQTHKMDWELKHLRSLSIRKPFMRRSSDDGVTWDDPSIIFPRHVGVNGSLSLVIDGNNQLHLFFGQRISGNPDIHGMWHSILLNNRWTEPDALIKGPRMVDKIGPTGFDPYDARAVVSQGNVLLVTWRTDPGDIKDNGIWFSYAVINAPETPISTLKSYESIGETPSSTLTSPVPTLFVESTLPPNMEQEPQNRGNFVWIVLSVILGFLVVVFILFNRSR